MNLVDLDDDCLLTIFTFLCPLPDLISLSKACRRFHNLTSDGRMRLLVLPSACAKAAGTREAAHAAARARNCRQAFKTLHEAVEGSRPGDRIVLDPGEHVVADVYIPWPLHLVGGGMAAEDTILRCQDSNDSALDFRASGRVANLTIQSTANACITHRQGNLTVEDCSLQCTGTGLNHLFAPLITYATVWAPQITALPVPVGVGALTVIQTKIRGAQGSVAVRTEGSGALQGVRIINLCRDTLFWFRVDSAEPAQMPRLPVAAPVKQEQLIIGHMGVITPDKTEGSVESAAAGVQPPWASSLASPSVAVLEQRAKAWHLAHHLGRANLGGDSSPMEVDGSTPKRRRLG